MGSIPPVPPGYNSFPPSGVYPPPPGSGIPPYPGPAHIQTMFPYGPSFDGLYNHGLTNNPRLNSLFSDVNAAQHQIYSFSGVGYPPLPPGGMPPNGMPYGGMPPQQA